ncbi:MAG: hypothetical protein KGZ69_01445 [Methylomonas sp.]|nr:hypothetical protein [Methylomonas sp.]
MPIAAKGVLERVRIVLQDEESVRWTLPELRLWFNDALREIVALKPTAFSTSIVLALAVGTRQAIPATYPHFLKITRNLKTTGESPRLGAQAVRTVDMEMLDASNIYWHDTSLTQAAKIVRNAAFDAKEKNIFWVYPPNDGTGIVEVVVSQVPSGIPIPASNEDDINSYDVNISGSDIYTNAIVDYVAYRAFSKDAEYAGSGQKAAAYFQQFAGSIGVMLTNDGMKNPNVKPSTEQENAA